MLIFLGGSSYTGGMTSNKSNISGSGTTPGNNADPDYQSSIGIGGAASHSYAKGGNGLVVITW